MGLAYRQVMQEITIDNVMSIRENPLKRLTTSPFGVTPEQYEKNPPRYIGNSVAWKGLKTGSIDSFARALASGVGLHGNIPSVDARERLVAGLRRAIAISKKYAGIKGTVLWNGKLYPKKCIEQKKG